MKPTLFVLGSLVAGLTGFAAPPPQIQPFRLDDQHRQQRIYAFPKSKITLMTVADYQGSRQLEPWVSEMWRRFGNAIDIDGVANVSNVPALLRDVVRTSFRRQTTRSIMLDWSGDVVRQFHCERNVANIYVIDRDGSIRSHFQGSANPAALRELTSTIESALRNGS